MRLSPHLTSPPLGRCLKGRELANIVKFHEELGICSFIGFKTFSCAVVNDLFEIITGSKQHFSDSCHACRKNNRFQIIAIIKCIIFDVCHTVRKRHSGKIFTRTKSVFLNARHTVKNFHKSKWKNRP